MISNMKHGKGTARRLLSVLLVLVICFGLLPGEIFAADGSTEVTGVETGDGKFKVPVMKAGRSGGASYEVDLKWRGGSRCALSEDGTRAEWSFTGTPDRSLMSDSSMGNMFAFWLYIGLNDTDPDEFELRLPAVLYSRVAEAREYGLSSGDRVEYAIDEELFLQSVAGVPGLSVYVLEGADRYAVGREYVLRLDGVSSMKAEIPVFVKAQKVRSSNILNDTYGFLDMPDGCEIDYAAVDKAGRSYGLYAKVSKSLSSLSASTYTVYSNQSWTMYSYNNNTESNTYRGSRVYAWNDWVERYYGVPKDAFDASSASGEAWFEYVFKVCPSGWSDGHLEMDVSPGQNGEAVSVRLASQSNSEKMEPVPESLYTVDGGRISFDVTQVALDQATPRSSMAAMMKRSLRDGYTDRDMWVRVLAKHPMKDIQGDGDFSRSSCTLDVNGFVNIS